MMVYRHLSFSSGFVGAQILVLKIRYLVRIFLKLIDRNKWILTVVMKYVEDYSRLLLTVIEYDEYLTFYLLKLKLLYVKS